MPAPTEGSYFTPTPGPGKPVAHHFHANGTSLCGKVQYTKEMKKFKCQDGGRPRDYRTSNARGCPGCMKENVKRWANLCPMTGDANK